jgi:hypothetical protein
MKLPVTAAGTFGSGLTGEQARWRAATIVKQFAGFHDATEILCVKPRTVPGGE